MSCSLSVYRARIGTFLPNTFRKSSSIPRTPSSSLTAPLAFIIVMTLYCSLALHVNIRSTNRLENDDCIATLENNNFENIEAMLSFTNPGITRLLVGNKKIKDLLETTGTVTTISHPWCNHREMNKLMHIYNGNRERRGRGINCIYWNKGPAFLANKQLDIKTIVEEHKPHILGLGEANVRSDHDLEDLQLSGYSLHLDSCIDNPQLDEMAPVKTIQTRTNYVPLLSDDTKKLQKERNHAQKKAASTGNPDDWRYFRSVRNRVTSSLRSEVK